jgi:benzoyl-CoA reductase subunit BamC
MGLFWKKKKADKGRISVKDGMKTKIIKQININIDKCIGCRACELACSAFHADTKYGSVGPAGSRIRVMVDEQKDAYVPVRAGDYTEAECNGRYIYVIKGKEYRECGFCKAVCPSRGYFKEPDTGIPLRCDMCESDPPVEIPWCVKVCGAHALTYEERETEESEDQPIREDLDTGLISLMDRYGMQAFIEAVCRKQHQ